MPFLEDGNVLPADRGQKHAHFQNDILTSARLDLLCTICFGVPEVVWGKEHNSKLYLCGIRADFLFQRLYNC